MPLPDDPKTAWPPKRLAPVFAKIATWSAWYSGDPDQLSGVYGGVQSDTTGFFSSERGGFIAAARKTLERWFWGSRPTQSPEPRTKLHVPIASDMAATSADLLFSEPPKLKAEDDATQAALDELIDDGVHATLLEAAEISAALSGVYLRVVWDAAHVDRPWLAAVHPDAAVPEWQWGRLSAVTFWRILSDDGSTVLRHLERHEPGAILHGLYEGTADTLGQLVPLTQHEATKGLGEALKEGNKVPTGTMRLTAGYIPNMRPNRLWRNLPEAAPLGRSDYAGVEPLMDALDETYSSWMRDIRLGKGRMVVPQAYLRPLGPGKGAVVDLDREVYEGVQTMGNDEGRMELTVAQFDIRVEEHSRTAIELMGRIVAAGGYSAQSFGLTGDVAMTATETAARERRSMITRDRKGKYWRPELRAILWTLLDIYVAVFGAKITPQPPTIEFGDAVSEDPKATAESIGLLAAADAISTYMKVKRGNPDWEEDQILEEVERIKKDREEAMPAPDAFGVGGPADNADDDNPSPGADE